ncbi:MAG TPA: alpha/beta hydrolase [Burkholderiaceae bacterium]|nr:alpha/beta hydrolase [Burkholderiaceae bacterium]
MKPRLQVLPRRHGGADSAPPDVAWEPPLRSRAHALETWNDYMAFASRVVGRFHGQFRFERFDYVHPMRLQPGTPKRMKRPYVASVAYTDWGPADAPVLLCCGGVANVAARFHYLASDLSDDWRVVCMDWLGRGRSAWLASEGDYSLATCAEQLRQMIMHLGGRPVTLLGSSMGGSAAIDLIARHPNLVHQLILNDVGPHIPARRRQRRAETIARHYVFRTPAELMRRVGAAQKNDGPVAEEIRFSLTFNQTRWSDEEGGRVYRHDVRAMQAYRRSAQRSLLQWDAWRNVHCRVLLIHGMLSDALLDSTIRRMSQRKRIAVLYIPDTGHTPVLADRNQIAHIRHWLDGDLPDGARVSVLHAQPRDPYPGNPISFAPASALR